MGSIRRIWTHNESYSSKPLLNEANIKSRKWTRDSKSEV